MTDPIETLFTQALTAQYQGQWVQAEVLFKDALNLDPSCKEAYYQLGEIYQEQRRFDEAIVMYEKVLTLDPEVQQVYNNLGVIAMLQGQTELAIEFYFKALQINPQFSLAHHNIGQLFCQQNQIELGLGHFLQAIQADPALEKHYFLLGLQALLSKHYGMAHALLEAVICYGGGLTDSALLKQAFVYRQELNHQAALYCYEQLAQKRKNDLGRLLDALYLPAFYQSETEVAEWRQRFQSRLQALAQGPPLELGNLAEMDLVHFPLAYHGENEVENLALLAQILRPHLPESVAKPRRLPASERLRVGFVSRFFSQHSVSLAYQKLLGAFPRFRWERLLFGLPGLQEDTWTQNMAKQVQHFEILPDNLAQARERLADAELDLLIYTDIGMDPLSYLLAFTRLAPVQVVLAGHPLTTGIPTLDYFISCQFFELPEAQSHYTECLKLLADPNVNYPRPELNGVLSSRRVLGLPESGQLFTCPMHLIKFHPAFDQVLVGILNQLAEAHLVLFDDGSALGQALRQRLQPQLGEAAWARLHFLPWAAPEQFLQILAQSDLILDSFPFGSGTTAYQALAVGTPIITCPGNYMRGRVCAGLYEMMGIKGPVAKHPQDYLELAVALGQDLEKRQALRAEILAKHHRIFNHSEGIEEMVVFLTAQVYQKRRGAEFALD